MLEIIPATLISYWTGSPPRLSPLILPFSIAGHAPPLATGVVAGVRAEADRRPKSKAGHREGLGGKTRGGLERDRELAGAHGQWGGFRRPGTGWIRPRGASVPAAWGGEGWSTGAHAWEEIVVPWRGVNGLGALTASTQAARLQSDAGHGSDGSRHRGRRTERQREVGRGRACARARAPEEDGAAAELKRLGELGLHGCESGLARMQAARDVDAENLEAGSRFPALGARDDAKNSIGWRSTASTLE